MPSHNLVLGRPSDQSVAVSAILDQGGQVYFEYGATSGNYPAHTSTLVATNGVPVTVVINGLQADAQYYYRMAYSADGVNWVKGDQHSFHTQRARNETFTFTVTSDSHLGQTFSDNTPQRYQQATLNIAADHPDFDIDLGDTFIMDAVTNQTDVNSVYLEQRSYYGNYSYSTPVFLAIGNHEDEEGWHLGDTPFSKALANITARKQYFLNPTPDSFYSGNTNLLPAIGGDQLRGDYYSWEWGNALFVVLDPFEYTMTRPYGDVEGSGEPDGQPFSNDQWSWTLGQDQYNWFKRTLENSNAKYKFVFSHHVTGGQLVVTNTEAGPPTYVRGGAMAAHYFEWGGYSTNGTWGFTTNRPGWQTPIHWLMVSNGVTAYFHGHDHQFVHEEIDGVVYQLVPSPGMTGSGFDLYENSPYVQTTAPYGLGNLPNSGHLRVTVSPTNTSVEYVRSAISGDTGVTNGEVSYSYTINAAAAPDTNAPVITTCATNRTISAGANCQASIPDLTSQVVASDNSGSVTISQSPVAGTLVGLGNKVVTLTAKDAANNQATCQATITVVDTTPPTITTCATNRTISAGANCQAAIPDLTTQVVASDTCRTVTITQTPVAGTLVGLGNTVVTLTAKDAANNQATCQATITVVDGGVPDITAQPQSVTNLIGHTVTFTVTATSCSAIGYQWVFGTNTFSNGNAATLTITNIQTTNAGNYTVVLTNSVGWTTSDVATLTVSLPAAPTVSIGPRLLANGHFQTTFTGTPDIPYTVDTPMMLRVPGTHWSISPQMRTD